MPLIKCQVSYKNMIVSSVNWKWEISSLDPIWMSLIRPRDFAFWMRMCSTCMTMINKSGDTWSSCRKPLSIWNSLEGLLLTRTNGRAWEIIVATHSLHFLPKPICCSVCKKKSQFTLSKAFSKSSLIISPFECYFWMLCTTLFIINIEFVACLPFTNDVCSSAIRFGMTVLILLARILISFYWPEF